MSGLFRRNKAAKLADVDDSTKKGGSGGSPTADTTAKCQKKTWIAVKVVDEDGKPVSGISVQLTGPDGTAGTYALSKKGEVKVKDIDPGKWKVAFPDIYDVEWRPG